MTWKADASRPFSLWHDSAHIPIQTDLPMLRFLLTRLSLIIPTFIGMTLVAFFLIRLVPGDPIETLAGERGIDPAASRRTATSMDWTARSWCSTAST
jgi:hypothetical protein